MSGDLASANAVLMIIDTSIWLVGLHRIEQESEGPRLVVLTPAQLAEWAD